jgi:hypothetical protein
MPISWFWDSRFHYLASLSWSLPSDQLLSEIDHRPVIASIFLEFYTQSLASEPQTQKQYKDILSATFSCNPATILPTH